MALVIDRRQFLKSAGLAFSASLMPQAASALARTDIVLASAVQLANQDFALALLDKNGTPFHTVSLPGRGHDVVASPDRRYVAAFARRPGTFALIVNRQTGETNLIEAQIGRHFYGHGQFSADGKILYATENQFETADGKIGLYDATNNFERIGEWDSHGIGPHDLLFSKDKSTLFVANGGIETHPDFGRTKLNLATMRPSIVALDSQSGSVKFQYELPKEFAKISTRHICLGANQDVWIGGQNQGDVGDAQPLLARLDENGFSWRPLPDADTLSLKGYIGSIAFNHAENLIGITSPVGNIAMAVSEDGNVRQRLALNSVCGIASAKANGNFHISSGRGAIGTLHKSGSPELKNPTEQSMQFDNHLRLFA